MGSMKSLISLLITSPAFRLLLSDVFVTARDIVADVAADIAKVAAIVEVRAEQAEEVIRPADAELAGEKDRAGGVGVPALEELARAGKSVEENTAEITNLALNESEEKRRAIWSRLEDESPDRIRDTALHRITEACTLPMTASFLSNLQLDCSTGTGESSIHGGTHKAGGSIPKIYREAGHYCTNSRRSR
jgi:hypothetical protein